MRRISKLIEGRQGDSVRLHPDDVSFRLQGDFDGDEIFLEFFDDDIAKKLKKITKKPAWSRMNKSVKLDGFKNPTKDTSYTNIDDFYSVAENIIQSDNSQGIVTNAKSVRSTLVLKNFKLNIDGVEIVPIREDETVQMLYAPLNDNYVLNPGDRIIEKDGEKYLETTSSHEISILMQAATDNTKEMLLGVWGYNGRPFMIDRIFKRTDGKPLTKLDTNILSEVINTFNYSTLRSGRDAKRRKLTPSEMFNESKKMAEFIELPSEEQSLIIAKKIESRFNNVDIRVSVNGKASPFETFFSELDKAFKQYNDPESGDVIVGHPLGYPISAYKSAVYYASFNLFEKFGIGKNTLEKGYKIANQMMEEYSAIFQRGEKYETEKMKIGNLMSFDYDSEINDFINKWKKELAKYGIDTKQDTQLLLAVSIHAYSGGLRVKKGKTGDYLGRDVSRMKLPPIELVSNKVHYDFMKFFGEAIRRKIDVAVGSHSNAFTDYILGKKLEC